MRYLAVICGILGIAFASLADEVPLEALPLAVRQTLEEERGAGTAKKADRFQWGNATIYQIEVDLAGIPDLELQIAENGKLIRMDRLQKGADDNSNNDEAGD